jgi:hypothetical protein
MRGQRNQRVGLRWRVEIKLVRRAMGLQGRFIVDNAGCDRERIVCSETIDFS